MEKINLMKIKLLCLSFLVFGFHACSSKRDDDSTVLIDERSVKVFGNLPNFEFTDQSDETFGSNDLLGKVWVADFIFTRCAGTCPMQTIEKVKMQNQLKQHFDKDKIHFVSFTVDPENDTPAALKKYAETHSANLDQWSFLTGAREDLWNLSSNGFKLAVAEDAKNQSMPILHSSRFVLVDRIGRIRGYYDGLSDKGWSDLLRDLDLVLRESNELPIANSKMDYKAFPYPKEIMDPDWLESRKELQLASSDNHESFMEFKFQDTVEESGITFKNQIVDDAGKYHKAVHYDHGNGIAIADIDSDGLLDIYFSTQIGPNELWKNLGNGKFSNVTTEEISLSDKIGVSASFADTDNDGDADLFVTTVRGGNYFFENDGNGKFSDATSKSGLGYIGHSSGAVFFDYDSDGMLDLFLCNVGVYTTEKFGEHTWICKSTEGYESEYFEYSESAQDFFNDKYDEIENLLISEFKIKINYE